jgi:F-type H+-transporting ATPase subunit delta
MGQLLVEGGDQTVSGMAGRYASALFELALEADALDSVAEDLDGFAAMMDESEDLSRLVRSPAFSREDQMRAIDAVLNEAGASGLVRKFIGLVTQNRRLFAIGDMIRGYRALLARHRGEVTAEVVSAEPLGAAQTTALAAALRERLGRDARLEARVDPGLLGGLVVRVGSKMIDTSLRTKLNNLRIAMKEVG